MIKFKFHSSVSLQDNDVLDSVVVASDMLFVTRHLVVMKGKADSCS